jgi:hypothetical protein
MVSGHGKVKHGMEIVADDTKIMKSSDSILLASKPPIVSSRSIFKIHFAFKELGN